MLSDSLTEGAAPSMVIRTKIQALLAGLVLLSAAAGQAAPDAQPAADAWPQLQNGPQRLGYSPAKVDLPLKNAWIRAFSPERLHPQAQPVIAEGKVFLGTEMGSFYAFDAKTGQEVWKFKAGGPILHTAGVEGGRVFFGCLDGKLYALRAADGAQEWVFESGLPTGFSTAVLLAEGNVYIANRGGAYYAVAQKDGKPVWRQDVGSPILMSSACDAGRLFFAAMDMRAYALDAKTGQVIWKSAVLSGAAFKDYWPVAYKGYVILRPMGIGCLGGGPAIEWMKGPLPEAELKKEQARIDRVTKSAAEKDLFVLNQSDGKEPFVVPSWTTNTMNGAVAPPCVDGDALLIVPVAIHDWRGGWGRLDLDKKLVTELLCEGPPAQGKPQPAGMGNGDENMLASSVGRLAVILHTEECNANFTGAWHLDRREWKQIGPYHADRFFVSNTQGGGGNAGAFAGGMLFHTSWNSLNARTFAKAE